MIFRTTTLIALFCSISVVPLLCTAGVTEHGCVCETSECCTDEATCEPDPCDVVYQKEARREHDQGEPSVVVPPLAGIEISVTGEDPPAVSPRYNCCNLPYPSSDLPLRV
jgi:hypothetical protein